MSNVKKEKTKKAKMQKNAKAKKAKVSKPTYKGNDGIGNEFDAKKMGEDVVRFRYDSQISQLAFAESMGISKTMIFDIEIGGNPTAKTLAKLLVAIDKPFERYIIKRKITAAKN